MREINFMGAGVLLVSFVGAIIYYALWEIRHLRRTIEKLQGSAVQ